jgi:hypothetical protein
MYRLLYTEPKVSVMKNKEIIEQEVEKTMQFLKPMDKLPLNPYFYTRVQAKIDNHRRLREHLIREGLFGSRLWRPALIGIIILLNLTTAILLYINEGTPQDTTATLAVEYGLNQDNPDYFANNK